MLTDSQIPNTSIAYLPSFRKRSYMLYWAVLLMVSASLIALPFVHSTIAVTAQGITRPQTERTEIKPVIAGIIDSIFYKEGGSIQKDAVILRLKDPVTRNKKMRNDFEIGQRQAFIHDLEILTANELNESVSSQLISPLYKEQLSRYLHQKSDQEASLKKANKEIEINTSLAKEKVISSKEFFDIQINQQKTEAAYKAFVQEQLSNWQQDLIRYKLELSQYRSDEHEVNTNASYYEVRAPVSGTIQGINDKYSGSLIQSNETICTISPDDSLIAECYVSPKDIGFIRLHQQAYFQIDAFDYNYFGTLTGIVISIDNDFTTVNNNAVFRVKCKLNKEQLNLKNGFSGKIRKGLTFQARFIIGERTLWQLLWDKLDNWLNPQAPQNI